MRQLTSGWLRRIAAPFRCWLFPEEGWATFAILAVTILIVVFSVEHAEWVKPMPSLALTAILALLVGFVMAKARVPVSLLHTVASLIGMELLIRQMANILPGTTPLDQRLELWDRLAAWIQVLHTGGISSDTVPFVALLLILAWGIGYFASWSVFRWHQAWPGLIPCGIALLVNLSYLQERFAVYFALFLFSSMLLVMRLNLSHLRKRWQGARIAGRIGWRFLIATLWLSLAIIAISWNLPLASANSQLTSVWERSSTPWSNLETEFNRLFASLTSSRATRAHAFGNALPLRGSISLGDQLVLKVKADAPGYWRAGVYDVYDGKGWVSGARSTEPLADMDASPQEQQYAKRKEITQTVELLYATDVIFATGEPLRIDIPARSQLTATPSFTINLRDSSEDMELPPNARSAAGVLRAAARAGSYPISIEEAVRYLPPDMRVLGVTRRGPRIRSLELTAIEPENRDIASVRSSERLGRWQRYTVVSSVPSASAEELKQAGESYPSWVVNRFLQLPAELPVRVRNLAQDMTEDARTPYEKAQAVEAYLRQLTYSVNITAPPYDGDAVDYFLFSSKAGYCDYFASSMAVMLRSVGVPARVAAGYITGEYDDENGVYMVRESHAHSWPEVFFPAYGWVEWEPTPAWPLITHTGDSVLDDAALALSSGSDSDELLEDELFLDEEMLGSYYGGPAISPFESIWEWAKWPVGLLLLAGILAFIILWFLWERSLYNLSYAAQVYEKLCRSASVRGLGHQTRETPYEFARRLSEHAPFSDAPIAVIADAYVKSRYGNQTLSTEELDSMKRAWETLRGKLLRYFLPGNRRRH
ncbi:MAG: transglutaminase domain-containing protein [Chloroflexota bacterium]